MGYFDSIGSSLSDLVNNKAQPTAEEINPIAGERLFQSRPRSILQNNDTIGYGGDRGTRAYIRLLSNNADNAPFRGKDTALPDSVITSLSEGNNKYHGYADFLLTNVSCAMEEKVQVTQVFGDAEVVYYFGRQPMAFSFSGTLIDSPDNNWFTNWISMYSEFMRGSQLARNYELLKIVLPNMVVTGTMSGFSWQQSSANDVEIPFTFQFLAKKIEPIPAQLSVGVFSPEMAILDFNNSDMPTMSQSSIEGIKKALANDPNSFAGKVDALSDKVAGYAGAFNSVSANLNGVRTALFSPVIGVLSSLTKLIKSVTGTLKSLTKSITKPLKNMLRDISNISNQVTGLLGAVNEGIDGLAMEFKSLTDSYTNTLNTLKKTSGALASAPRTMGDSLRGLANSGKINSTPPFLSSGSHSAFTPVLSSGASRAATSAAPTRVFIVGGPPLPPLLVVGAGTEVSGSGRSSNKMKLLNMGRKRTPDMGASL